MLNDTSPASRSLQLGCVTIVGIMALKFAQSEGAGPHAGSPTGRTTTAAVAVSCPEQVPTVANTLKVVFVVRPPVGKLKLPPVLRTAEPMAVVPFRN